MGSQGDHGSAVDPLVQDLQFKQALYLELWKHGADEASNLRERLADAEVRAIRLERQLAESRRRAERLAGELQQRHAELSRLQGRLGLRRWWADVWWRRSDRRIDRPDRYAVDAHPVGCPERALELSGSPVTDSRGATASQSSWPIWATWLDTATAVMLSGQYQKWIDENEPGAVELSGQRQIRFASAPTITLLLACHDPWGPHLVALLDSVVWQSYPNWELCVAEASAADHAARRILGAYAARNERIHIQLLDCDPGHAGRVAAAAKAASGDFLAIVDANDWLAPFALFEMARSLQYRSRADLIYSDEDLLDQQSEKRRIPYFKPAWSPDTLRSHNYIGRLAAIRRDVWDKIGGVSTSADTAWEYDLILRATERAKDVVHVPKVLYHRRPPCPMKSGSAQPTRWADETRALDSHLRRSGVGGSVVRGTLPGTYHVRYALKRHPLVSVLIPNRDALPLLARCIESVVQGGYAPYEIVIIENGSQDPQTFAYYATLEKRPGIRLLRWAGEFNYSAINNFAVAQCAGELVLLLNNDVEGLSRSWLRRLVEHAVRPEIGAVGAKLRYPDGRMQHGGVIVGLGGMAAHAHQGVGGDRLGYFGRLVVTHNLSAVTAACLMTRRAVFEAVSGLDEGYPVNFGDVDFCLRIRERGWRIVWSPLVECLHHESITRGADDTPGKQARFQTEAELFIHRWADLLRRGDPYYSPNLTLERNDFALRLEPEPRKNFLVYPPEMRQDPQYFDAAPRAA